MFWRRWFTRGDAVDAAQRRLALLAGQLRGELSSENQPGPVADRTGGSMHQAPVAGRHLPRDDVRLPARRSLTPHHVAVLALVVAAVVAVAAWVVTRSAPRPEPVHLSSERAPIERAPTIADVDTRSTATGAASSSAAGATSGTVVVDVAGRVRRPGIVELPAGCRVVDALKAAGGVRRGVDLSGLNQARVLVDGEQIVVGSARLGVAPPTAAPTGPAGPAALNLNTATLEQLDTLPGIGPVTAQAILDWRAEHGAFSAIEELLEVSGIGDVTFSDIEAYVHV